MIFSAEIEISDLRSALLPNIILGTSGSKFYFNSFTQNKRLSADLSEVNENTKKIASEFLKKFLATDLNLSCPDVSQSSTPTFLPITYFSWYL